MKLVVTKTFSKSYKKFTKNNSKLKSKIDETIHNLSKNPFDNKIDTHKLSGNLIGLLSCSCGYDCRIVFQIIEEEQEKFILLLDIGTHDDVY